MPLSTQLKLLNSIRELLTEEGKIVLPSVSDPKPDFPENPFLGRPLPRCTPEEVGVDSHLLETFCREVAAAPDANAHSLMVLRNGKVICEGYFSLYRKGVWHICHSLSKSFIGTAIGIAMSEGLIHLDAKFVDYFPEETRLLSRRRMRNLTVRHALNMTSGISFNELGELVEKDWLRGIFSSALTHEPGKHFEYNSMNSYLLAALIKKTTGYTVMEYLRPRLFEPLGFGPIDWEKCPSGVEKGGWGMYALPEDLAKLGQLYLNLGHWHVEGRDVAILPERWVQEATSIQATSEEGECYGYQMWVDKESGYPVMNGMFGQYVALVPPLNLAIVMTSGCPRSFAEAPVYHLIQKHFFSLKTLPAKLPPNPASLASLKRTLQALRFRHPVPAPSRIPQRILAITRGARWNSRPLRGENVPGDWADFLGTTWRFSQNRAGILPVIIQAMDNNFTAGVTAIRLEREQDRLRLYWEEEQATFCLPAGIDKPAEGTLRIGEETFLTACLAELKSDEDDKPVLRMEICLLEHSSLRILKFQRQGDNILLQLDEHPSINGALQMAMNRKNDGFNELPGGSAMGSLLKNDFLQYRIAQLCTPKLTGIPT